ncbi:MAG TPA: tetratricopeptide repeat protein [Pirellulales bacterium]|jgi:Tfp pilus assembly protein PilF|nr:tetratricopeptide repeat protein [Pirellulales bacterium]
MSSASEKLTKPDEFAALVALAQREHQAGRLAAAAAAYQRVLAVRPDFAVAHNDLGIIHAQQGRLDQALAWFERAISLQPDYADAHNNLGIVLLSLGKPDEAAARFEQALAIRPAYAEAQNNLGNILAQQGQLDRARSLFEQAIALQPDYVDAHNNLGNALRSQDKLADAAVHFEQALALRPNHAEGQNNLGNVLLNLGRFDEAEACYHRSLALRPDYAESHNDLGIVLARQDKLEQAQARFERTIALAPTFAKAHSNLANVLLNQGQLDKAATLYQQALALQPSLAEAHMGLALCHLAEGDFPRGWPEYEARPGMPTLGPQHGLARWTGESLAGRSLLLLSEQGLGDTIQFVRYARLLKQQGARVVLVAQRPLGRLLASYPDLDELFIRGSDDELPRCDYYLPLLSLPGVLGTTVATIPGEVPYLSADPALIARWHDELAAIEGFKIGIAWQGSRDYPSDRQRSIPLADFAPLARVPGVRLISLQKGFGSEQVASIDFPVIDLASRLDEDAGPFMDTVAVIRNLDLVVTADTALGHLAGALGARVFLALALSPDWRWLRRRDDSPWYPTVRLFRQTTRGAWPDVLERIAEAVEARRAAGGTIQA